MDIRVMKKEEIMKLVEIWYEGSLIAHHFIDRNYWKANRKEMEEKYLPQSETYVIYDDEDEIKGFISLMESYLAALFIDVKQQGKGYGTNLLNYAKEKRENLQLKVYKKNSDAVTFYLNNGFVIKQKLIDDETSEEELLMEWRRI